MSHDWRGIALEHAHVLFGDRVGIAGIDLRAARGERVALLGPSGAGKTSLLRAAAGLGGLASGTVRVDGRDVTTLPPERRGIVYMHQTPSLFPHLSVVDNVAFPLEVRGTPRPLARSTAMAHLEQVQLGPLAARAPATLSGGQRHRVALARALAAQPAALLLDEPFSSLDPALRADVREATLGVLREPTGPAVILVTHDVDEAAMIADRLVVLLDGRVAQAGTATDLLARPASIAVATFLGLSNLIPGVRDGQGVVTSALGRFADAGPTGPVTLAIRPGALRAVPPDGHGTTATVLGLVEQVSGQAMRVRCDDLDLLVTVARGFETGNGTLVRLDVDPAAVHIIDGRRTLEGR